MKQSHLETEQLEAYLLNRLDAAAAQRLEDALQADPLAQEEFTFQREVIAAIQTYRKQELKERLRKLEAMY